MITLIDASLPAPANSYMGILVADMLHAGDVSGFLRNESGDSLKAMREHIVKSEPGLHAFLKLLQLPDDGGPSWWLARVVPAINEELRRRSRPKPARGGRIAELKASLDLAEVTQHYTELRLAGPGKLKGKCPLHEERTPSFYVYEDSQKWRCFGACATGGDVLDLLREMGDWDGR